LKKNSFELSFYECNESWRRRLINHRMSKGLNLAQAAQLAGLSRTGLEKIESGAAKISLESLFQLCSFYEESIPDFMTSAEADYVREQLKKRKTHNQSAPLLIKKSVRNFSVESEKRQAERDLKNAAGVLGLASHLEDLYKLAQLEKKNPEGWESLRTLIHLLR
jgi:transcriptional regulator with XRE-family HTH domain